jgi:hypothetical protein
MCGDVGLFPKKANDEELLADVADRWSEMFDRNGPRR